MRLPIGLCDSAVRGTRYADGGQVVDPADAAPLKPGEDWRERLRRVLRLRHYAWRTETSYIEWVARFLDWRGEDTEPTTAQTDEVRRFLEHLAVEREVSASTQNQAFSALLFFFDHVLQRPLGNLRGPIEAHLRRVRLLFEADRRDGLPGVWLPGALVRYGDRHVVWAWKQSGSKLPHSKRFASPIAHCIRRSA
ncbi:MAG: site-specific integrase [Verrucomicrobia bacterium]|nr:site-specific integrase [Verrucomicrobiota bacterium]